MLNSLQKQRFFANLKKYPFYKDKVCFLSYVVLPGKVKIEDKQIKTMKNWLELMLIRDIQVFISFINFYQRFI